MNTSLLPPFLTTECLNCIIGFCHCDTYSSNIHRMATIDHFPPEENYGGGYYSSSDEVEIYDEEEIIEEEYVADEELWVEGDEVIVCDDVYEEYEELHEVNNSNDGGGGMAAMIAAAARNRAKRVDDCGPSYIASSETAATSVGTDLDDYGSFDDDEDVQAGGGMAALIAAAATKRNQRINEGGEVKIRDVAPAPETTPDAQGFAAMAAAAASKRNNRIESGGELQIREVQEIPEEHRNVFVSIAEEAANVGRLVRLNEVVVEAESSKSNEKVDTWSGPGGLLDYQRSHFMRAVNEAAAVGRLRRLKATEVTSYDTTLDYKEEQRVDIDEQVDQYGRKALRTHFLLEEHVREESKEKRDQWAPENFDVPIYRSIDEVELPTEKVPAFRPKKANFMSQRDALEAISSAVAASAWDRNYRLQRPKAQLKVTRGCACPYCKNPNPYQTHKYKKMYAEEMRASENSDRQPENTSADEVTEKETNETIEIPFYLKPPEGKVYEPCKPEAEKKWADDQEYNKRKVSDAPKTVKWQPPKKSTVPAAFQGGNKPAPKPYQPRPSIEKNQTNELKPTPISTTQGNSCEPVPLSIAGQEAYQSWQEDSDGGYYNASKTGTKVLLDETIDFGTRHKKVHIKKEKPAKEKKKKGKSKKSKKGEKGEGGCTIM